MSEDLIIPILSAETESAWQSLVEAELRIQELSEEYVKLDHLIKRAEELQRNSWRARLRRLLDSPDLEHENRINRLKSRLADSLKEALVLDAEHKKLKAKLSQVEYKTVNSPMVLAIRLAVWENIKRNFGEQLFASELRSEE